MTILKRYCVYIVLKATSAYKYSSERSLNVIDENFERKRARERVSVHRNAAGLLKER